MGQAFLWGFVGAASLILGAVVSLWRPPGDRTLGLTMGFGAGVLISALSFELVAKAAATENGIGGITLGLYLGCAAFTIGDLALERWAGRPETDPDGASPTGGLSIALGALLDGVPECAVLGLTVLQGGEVGVAMLLAVFLSNIPEGVAATTSLRLGGWTPGRIVRLWIVIVIACGIASPIGYALLDGASAWLLAVIFAFAAGAILTMLATSMMPTAYRLADRLVGPVTVAGFALAFLINWVAG